MMAGTRFASLHQLDQLLAELNLETAVPATAISGIAVDSRQVEANYAFLACAGSKAHGFDHAHQAVDRGAVVVLAEPDGQLDEAALQSGAHQLGVPVVIVPALSRVASAIAARFYEYPAEQLRIIGVTGTNGKTSVTHFLAQALPEEWHCGTIGTMGYGFPEDLRPGNHTTPDPVILQAELERLHSAGAKAVAIEVSSHALDQHRVAAVPFHTAIFTNLSRDHLDYHGTLTAYADAKSRLFHLPGLQQAILNIDDDLGAKLCHRIDPQVDLISCSRKGQHADNARHWIELVECQSDAQGMHLQFATSWGNAAVHTELLGQFNIDNLMLVMATLLSWDMPLQQVIERLQGIHTVEGRMQRFGGEGQPMVVVDFAHTPDAMEQALKALRAHSAGQLICVFGCGGDRDTGKRPLMGAVAEALSDVVIVTDDNPRHENPIAITDDILQGFTAPDSVRINHNRAEAIRAAIALAVPGDVVLIAGKGHERTQQVGDLCLPFSDAEQVCRVLDCEVSE